MQPEKDRTPDGCRMPWGLCVKQGASPRLLKGIVGQWHIPAPALPEPQEQEPAVTFWQMCLGAIRALPPLGQNRFCCQSQRTAAMGRSRRRSRTRRHLGAAFPAPVLCSHPPSAAPAHASRSRAMGILFPSVGATPPWLVPGAGFGHPQHCFEPATSEGKQA